MICLAPPLLSPSRELAASTMPSASTTRSSYFCENHQGTLCPIMAFIEKVAMMTPRSGASALIGTNRSNADWPLGCVNGVE